MGGRSFCLSFRRLLRCWRCWQVCLRRSRSSLRRSFWRSQFYKGQQGNQRRNRRNRAAGGRVPRGKSVADADGDDRNDGRCGGVAAGVSAGCFDRGRGRASSTMDAFAKRSQSTASTVSSAVNTAKSQGKQNGFARGTASAPRGRFLVGENGPEEIELRGGERIYSATQSRARRALATGGGSGAWSTTTSIWTFRKCAAWRRW